MCVCVTVATIRQLLLLHSGGSMKRNDPGRCKGSNQMLQPHSWNPEAAVFTAASVGERSWSTHSSHPNSQSGRTGPLHQEALDLPQSFFVLDPPAIGTVWAHWPDVAVWMGPSRETSVLTACAKHEFQRDQLSSLHTLGTVILSILIRGKATNLISEHTCLGLYH